MAYPDSKKEKAYSWLNIVLILTCLTMFGTSTYFFAYPDTAPQLIQRLGLTSYFNDKMEKLAALKQTQRQEAMAQPEKETVVIKEVPDLEQVEIPQKEEDLLVASALGVLPISAAQPTEIVIDSNLPLIDESDPLVLEAIEEFSEQTLIVDNLLEQDLLRSTVVFIDNFSRGEFLASFSPLLATDIPFRKKDSNGKTYVSVLNYHRYDNYTKFIDSIDSEKIVATYYMLKPLIDQTYAEISLPGVDFDEVLNDAIEMALSVPVINGPISLKSPSVMYLYNNPTLEALNHAQKLLLRLGGKNLTIIQAKLVEIQAQLMAQSTSPVELNILNTPSNEID
ncbi:DUF3014 domain-containing protein [Psychromonas sp. SR45-3]|uniref:DUF3014 domain-containing protein n=1 Tax=Psychromonas sp. SR45-3 TaxID=2760930 RepID=UPI0015F9B06D|nr:DUF3014 domain-containing protein [Psychromonas sp. SR45-3]MBB1272177.1 DUF3014 domain-containing protein [Psychromonas sp. SR45-3]